MCLIIRAAQNNVDVIMLKRKKKVSIYIYPSKAIFLRPRNVGL